MDTEERGLHWRHLFSWGLIPLTIFCAIIVLASGCSRGVGVEEPAIQQLFEGIHMEARPDQVGPGETTLVTISLALPAPHARLEAVSINVDYRPPLVPQPQEIRFYENHRPALDLDYRTVIEGGYTLTLRILLDDALEEAVGMLLVTIPFVVAPEAVAPVKQSVPIDVDVKVGAHLAPEVTGTQVLVLPAQDDAPPQ